MDGTTEAALAAVTSSEGSWLTEHYSKRVIAGDTENVRANLKFALEKFDYFVETEKPSLVVRRKTQLSGYGGKLLAGNVLPFVKRLQISLTTSTENSTVANFGYAVMNSAVTKGHRRTIEREIDALVALAYSCKLQTLCPACGTINTNDSRFCRVCGVPNAAGEPAEIEVFRLTANARAAYQTMLGGIIFTVCWLTLVVPLWLLSQQTLMAAAIILGSGAAFGSLWTMRGMLRLHRTLNPPAAEKELPAANTKTPSILLENNQTAALPPQEISQTSITEGTTELLPGFQKENALPKAVHKVSATNPELFK